MIIIFLVRIWSHKFDLVISFIAGAGASAAAAIQPRPRGQKTTWPRDHAEPSDQSSQRQRLSRVMYAAILFLRLGVHVCRSVQDCPLFNFISL